MSLIDLAEDSFNMGHAHIGDHRQETRVPPLHAEAIDNAIDKAAAAVGVFDATEPDLWFFHFERYTKRNRLEREEQRFDALYTALPPHIRRRFKSESMNVEDRPYSRMKTAILAWCIGTPAQRTRELLEGEELGDRKPSELLASLRKKAGADVSESFLREMCLSKLPPTVAIVLKGHAIASLDDLIKMADDMIESVRVRQVAAIAPPNEYLQAIERLTAKVAALETRGRHREPAQKKRGRSASRGRRSRDPSKHPVCFYHFRFKEKAKKCEKPCSFRSGNE